MGNDNVLDIHYEILFICKEKLNLQENRYSATVFREVIQTAKGERSIFYLLDRF